MKKMYPFAMLALLAAFILSATLSAQETKVTVKVEKDGKVVKDTTYSFDDAEQANHAIKMMEVMSGDEEHHGDHSNEYVFISEDGEKTEIKSMSGDSHVWVSEGEEHGDHVHKKKIKVMISDDEEVEVEVEKEVKKNKSKKQ
jgi:methionine-rich copper-binding protein CopC